jgi:hypothetical protein
VRQRLEAAIGDGHFVLVLHVQIHKVVAMPPVQGQDDEHEEIRGEDEGLGEGHEAVSHTIGGITHGTGIDYMFGLRRVKSMKGAK